MGVIAEATVAYAQPLIDETDGSLEEVNRAVQLAMLCWNLSLVPEDEREEAIGKMRASLNTMDDAEFEEFRSKLILPMIRLHEEMFPAMHGRSEAVPGRKPLLPKIVQETLEETPSEMGRHPGTGRNDPCPCGSGKKYKRCCGP